MMNVVCCVCQRPKDWSWNVETSAFFLSIRHTIAHCKLKNFNKKYYLLQILKNSNRAVVTHFCCACQLLTHSLTAPTPLLTSPQLTSCWLLDLSPFRTCIACCSLSSWAHSLALAQSLPWSPWQHNERDCQVRGISSRRCGTRRWRHLPPHRARHQDPQHTDQGRLLHAAVARSVRESVL